MATEKSSSSNPLEQFVLLAKTMKGAAAVGVIKQALEAPGVYVFGELLDMPNIQELSGGAHAPYFNLLNIFAYGTYKDYKDRKAHIIAFITSEGNSTEFSSDVVQEMTSIYSKYGGYDMAKATTTWEHVIGESWNSNSTVWVFYGPMPDIDSVNRMFKSDDIMNITSEFPTLVKNMQMYGIESFFNTGSRANIHQGTLLIMCFCILLLW